MSWREIMAEALGAIAMGAPPAAADEAKMLNPTMGRAQDILNMLVPAATSCELPAQRGSSPHLNPPRM
jgi:hypothetical protein